MRSTLLIAVIDSRFSGRAGQGFARLRVHTSSQNKEGTPVLIALRLKVERRQIAEIERAQFESGLLHRPFDPARDVTGTR